MTWRPRSRAWRLALEAAPRLRGALRRLRAHRPLPARARRRWTRGAQATRPGRPSGRAPPVEAEPGRLALVRRKGGPSLAVVLGVHAIRGHRVLLDALLPHGAVVRLKSGMVKRVFWATPPLNIPRDLQRGGRPDNRGLKSCPISSPAARCPS